MLRTWPAPGTCRSRRSRRVSGSASRVCTGETPVDDIDAGRKEGLATSERNELVELRRANRVQAMEIEFLKRARVPISRGRTFSQKADPARR